MTKFILALCLCFSLVYASACDICGCAASSFSLGLLPNSQHHFIGLRSTFRLFESTPFHDEAVQRKSNELFSTTELFGRYKISKRFQLLGFVPYVYNTKNDSVEQVRVNGLGDVTVLGNFVFVHNTDSLSHKFKHSGTVGLGVKAPTGESFRLGFTEINMLPGTGSFDVIANLNYSLQYRSFGLQNETGFTYKTANRQAYRFGNALSISQVFFYRWNLSENLKLIPQLGINFMHNWKDRKNGQLSEDTFNGGNIVNGQFNLFVLYHNWGLSAQVYMPLAQELNSGYVKQKSMFRASINYFIKQKSK